MKVVKWIYSLLVVLSLAAGANFAFAHTDASSPVGLWKTIDDVTGKEKSVVKISEHNDRLSGKVVKIFAHDGANPKELCVKCKGELKDQKIMGMRIMWDLKQTADKPNEWTGGTILDPHNGKEYHCMLNVLENGQKLRVRGYFGVPLLGRSQVWVRMSHGESE